MQFKLAISIPTYNRSNILKFNLIQILNELIEFDIPVYISDDSTNEETKDIIEELKIKHNLLYYFKNSPSLGHDLNCLKTIQLPKEDYVWFLGDSMIIKKGALKKILDAIKIKDYDFISCNADGRKLNINSKIYNDGSDLMNDLGWHLTLTGATIYKTSSLLDLRSKIEKFKNFPQLALIFEKFAVSNSSLLWINDKLIYGNSNKKSYWSREVFEVFITDFKNFAQNLSEIYTDKSKTKLVLEHSIKTELFSYRRFILYRINDSFNKSVFLKYKNDFQKYTKTNALLLNIIAILPFNGLKFSYKLLIKIWEIKKK